MPDIIVPFPFGDLPLKPELTGKIKVSDDVQQTLSTLLAWDGSSRRLLRCSRTAILQVTSPQVRSITHSTGSGANDVITFDDTETAEVMVRGHPSNTGLIWVTVGETPTVNNSWPLAASDNINLSIDNLNRLQILIVVDGEKVIVIHTR